MKKESNKHFSSALIPDMMLSEDEQEDENGSWYFVIQKWKFQTQKFEKLLKVLLLLGQAFTQTVLLMSVLHKDWVFKSEMQLVVSKCCKILAFLQLQGK